MNRMRDFSLVFAVLLILGSFAGCESDSTTPQDEVPPPSEANAVFVAGYLASYVSHAYDVFQNALKSAGDKAVSTETFTAGGVSGIYTLDFRAADGTTPAPSGSAEWVHAFTSEGQQIEVRENPGDAVPLAICTFDATAFPYVATPDAETGTVNGGGTLHAGLYTTEFTVEDLELSMADYPPAGAITYTAGDHHVTVQFDGTQYAALTVGENHYTVDLDTGATVLVP
jgi:hypothetical protein